MCDSLHHAARLSLDVCRDMRVARCRSFGAAVADAREDAAEYCREEETYAENARKEPWKALVDVLRAGDELRYAGSEESVCGSKHMSTASAV